MLTLRHLAPGEAWPGGKGGSAAEAKAGGKPAAKPPTGGAKHPNPNPNPNLTLTLTLTLNPDQVAPS